VRGNTFGVVCAELTGHEEGRNAPAGPPVRLARLGSLEYES